LRAEETSSRFDAARGNSEGAQLRALSSPYLDYLAAMDELWPRLPQSERSAKLAWERSKAFTRDSDWPGWEKYLGICPVAAVNLKERSA